MADTHLQINPDGTTATRKTVLWPSKKNEQELILKSIFERGNWKVSSIENPNGSLWKITTFCSEKTYRINLYISSIRDESRQADEFKMQLGTTYPDVENDGWTTLVLGIYTIDDGVNPPQYILSGYNWRKYDFSGNPSIRGTRTSGLQKALLFGMFKTDISILFRPDFIYYYIEYSDSLFGIENKESNKDVMDYTSRQIIFYGAPGTGKSHHITDDLGVKKADEKNLVFRTTFHPDSDYSTFVGCYKPTMKSPEREYFLEELVAKLNEIKLSGVSYPIHKFSALYWKSLKNLSPDQQKQILKTCEFSDSMSMELYKGIAIGEDLSSETKEEKIVYTFSPQAFTDAYVAAWRTTENVYLIIEEINRGNCAQIFGDLFQLLDRDGEGYSKYEITPDADLKGFIARCNLKVSGVKNSNGKDISEKITNGELLKLPKNLYIWATMNTSDQSLFPIDSAFKRRWEWEYIPINYKCDDSDYTIVIDKEHTYKWPEFLKRVNKLIYEETKSEDKQMGNFFVSNVKKMEISCNQFVSKVMFYLWNDICKDNPKAKKDIYLKKSKQTEEGKEDKLEEFKFSDLFLADGKRNELLIGFMTNLFDDKSGQ